MMVGNYEVLGIQPKMAHNVLLIKSKKTFPKYFKNPELFPDF
jgi:hypothetical protein